MKTVAVALIGITGYAETHYREVLRWRDKGRLKIVAATVINQEKEKDKCDFLRKIGCEIFDDYRAMLARWDHKIDLCIIPTGIPLHAKMTLAALGAGCNVLLEKPAAATIQEVDAMIAGAAEAGRFVAVGYQHMYMPEVQSLKKAVLDGLVGEVECIKCMGLWPRFQNYYLRNNWAGRLSVESAWVLDAPFNNAFAHWLNLLCFLAGPRLRDSAEPRSIRAELYHARDIESADTACLQIRIPSGIPLFLWVTHCCADNSEPVLEVRGSKGSLLWTGRRMDLQVSGKETLFMRTCGPEEIRERMYQAVLGKVDGGGDFICDLSIARKQTLCADAAFESSIIHPIPARHLSVADDGRGLIVIGGIGDLCRKAFAVEKLWSEMDVEWAREPLTFELGNYTEFHGAGRAAAKSP